MLSALAREARLEVDVSDDVDSAVCSWGGHVPTGRTGLASRPWSAIGTDGEREPAQHGITVRCLRRPDGTLTSDRDADGLMAIIARAY